MAASMRCDFRRAAFLAGTGSCHHLVGHQSLAAIIGLANECCDDKDDNAENHRYEMPKVIRIHERLLYHEELT
jgi:hypothetical protein